VWLCAKTADRTIVAFVNESMRLCYKAKKAYTKRSKVLNDNIMSMTMTL
jgi:hypothetical protein